MAHAMRDLAGIIMVKPPIGSKPWSRSRSHIAKVTDLVLNEIRSAASTPAAGSHPTEVKDTLVIRLVQRLGTPGAPDWFDELDKALYDRSARCSLRYSCDDAVLHCGRSRNTQWMTVKAALTEELSRL
jgi:hypothetical protein